ncbi:DUF4375 domain-containing protein [Cupriavidus sp. 2MCAB6]|uniref:DMP19 family protein n=1 Tax=Cupriavidus sp. 2MCAB6 TaxID=3232981 RepID=UPI003F8F9BBD
MNERLPCTACSEFILADTAARTGGLCMPCKGGYRQQIDDGRKRRQLERQYEESAERKYRIDLVSRVHGEGGGFQSLVARERTYFAVICLIGEVYGGGFHQFFSNSAGELYDCAFDGLLEMEASQSPALLLRAKELLFGQQAVPLERRRRNELLPNLETFDTTELDALEKDFWADPDKLGDRCARFAHRHGLYSRD